MTKQEWVAVQLAAKEGYVVAPPERLGDEGYKKHGHGVPNATRRMVYRRDGYQCAMCSSVNGLQIHHIIKRSQGGSDMPDNLIALCWKCHAVAHGMKFDDYPDYINEDWMEQHIVEYISDWVAENKGEPWYPYK